MNFPDENMEMRTSSGRKANLGAAVLLFLLVAGVACFAYLKSRDIDIRNINLSQLFSGTGSVQEIKPTEEIGQFSYESKEKPVFAVYKDWVVECSRQGVVFLDKQGKEVRRESLTLNQPIVKTNESDLLVADAGGKDVYVLDGKGVKWQVKTEESLLNADISREGYVSVLMAEEGYKGKVTVYDPVGTERFSRYIAHNFVVTVRISPSSRQMAVGSINTAGTRSCTNLEFWDMNTGEPNTGHILKPADQIYPMLLYGGDDSLYAVGSEGVIRFDRDRQEKWSKDFHRIYSACVIGGQSLAAVVDAEGGTLFKVFGTDGQERASLPVAGEVRNMSSTGNVSAVNAVREVLFITDRGRILGKYSSKSDIVDIYFFSRQQAAVITKSNVAVVRIGG